MLSELIAHIEALEARIARFDTALLDGLADEHNTLVLLQTLPSVDRIGAAMLLEAESALSEAPVSDLCGISDGIGAFLTVRGAIRCGQMKTSRSARWRSASAIPAVGSGSWPKRAIRSP